MDWETIVGKQPGLLVLYKQVQDGYFDRTEWGWIQVKHAFMVYTDRFALDENGECVPNNDIYDLVYVKFLKALWKGARK